MARERLLFLDEDLDKRLARELRLRGRHAETIYKTDLCGTDDTPLVAKLDELYGADVVLVTGNDGMPTENGDGFRVERVALATIDTEHPDGYHLNEWRRENVHRWAHAMQTQAPGTMVRYGGARPRPWRVRTQRRLWTPAQGVKLAERYARTPTA
jgi:hypothetical protein